MVWQTFSPGFFFFFCFQYVFCISMLSCVKKMQKGKLWRSKAFLFSNNLNFSPKLVFIDLKLCRRFRLQNFFNQNPLLPFGSNQLLPPQPCPGCSQSSYFLPALKRVLFTCLWIVLWQVHVSLHSGYWTFKILSQCEGGHEWVMCNLMANYQDFLVEIGYWLIIGSNIQNFSDLLVNVFFVQLLIKWIY